MHYACGDFYRNGKLKVEHTSDLKKDRTRKTEERVEHIIET